MIEFDRHLSLTCVESIDVWYHYIKDFGRPMFLRRKKNNTVQAKLECAYFVKVKVNSFHSWICFFVNKMHYRGLNFVGYTKAARLHVCLWLSIWQLYWKNDLFRR